MENINGTIIGILISIIILFLFTRIKKNSKYAKFAITLKNVKCPNCHLQQSFFRLPKNKSQILFGGYTCPNCNTELDKFGTKINTNSHIS